jgi:serine protease Do
MATANRFVSAGITVGRELAEVGERLRRLTVQVQGADSGRGSGVIWRPEGLVVTNAHVANTLRHTVQIADGRVFDAERIRRDPRIDLAILRIGATGLPSAQWRNPCSLRAGELVVAVGNPREAVGALAIGVVSATPKAGDLFLRADIRLVPGNSGGPLADAEGSVVGINSMVAGGFGVAVTSTAVESLLREDRLGEDRRIGVTLAPAIVRAEGTPVFGLVVVELEPGGPAHLSGVMVGDVIVQADGRWLRSAEQLSHAIHASTQKLPIRVLREGRLQSCEVVVLRKRAAEVA